MFGVLGGPAGGYAIAKVAGQDPMVGVAVGTALEGVKYLLDVGSRLGADWKPMVFGNWYKERITKLLKNEHDE